METKQDTKTRMPMLPKKDTLNKEIKLKYILIIAAVVCIGILLYYSTTVLLEKHDTKLLRETGNQIIQVSKNCQPIIISIDNNTASLINLECLQEKSTRP